VRWFQAAPLVAACGAGVGKAGGCVGGRPGPGRGPGPVWAGAGGRGRRRARWIDCGPRYPMATVLLPLPSLDFDPTEVAVSWAVLRSRGHDVVFATPDGRPARADELMVSGRGLDPWGAVPGLDRLTVVGRILRANAAARRALAVLQRDPGSCPPCPGTTWSNRIGRASFFPVVTGPGACNPIWRAPSSSRRWWDSSPGASRWRPSATGCW